MIERKSSWQLRAACRGTHNPDTFFLNTTKDGKESCKGCPVIDLCRTYAIAHDEYGIWGGMSRYQRHKLGAVIESVTRLMYYQAGLLEYRPWLEEYLTQMEEPQRELSSPTSLLEAL